MKKSKFINSKDAASFVGLPFETILKRAKDNGVGPFVTPEGQFWKRVDLERIRAEQTKRPMTRRWRY